MLNGNVVIETQFFDGDLLVSTSKVKTNDNDNGDLLVSTSKVKTNVTRHPL